MRKGLLISLLGISNLFFGICLAQAPPSFRYQAIARDLQGNVIANSPIAIRISLLEGSSDGDAVYSELHDVTTNSLGLINLNIGQGDYRSGDFSQIDWGGTSHYIKLEMDADGGSDFKPMGTTELLSVPYALYSETSGNSLRGTTEWTNDGTNVFTDGTDFPNANVGIGITLPVGRLNVRGVGWGSPLQPMINIEHEQGYSSTFLRAVNNPGNALFLLKKARGSVTSLAPVQANDNVGMIRMEAWNGTAWKETGWVRSVVDGNLNGTKIPGALLFATADTAGNNLERMRIINSGNVGMGTTTPKAKLDVNGKIKSQSLILTDANGQQWEITVDITGALHQEFYCGSLLYDNRDGQYYQTILIGTQCWMVENLNVGTMINSTTGGQLQTNNGTIEKYCYNNIEDSCDAYGGLYEWNEAMQYVTTEGAQGICPVDWHLPTDGEWKILEGTVDSQYPVGDPVWDNEGWRVLDAGGNLKEAGTTHWNSPNAEATNESGFTGLPGGYRPNYNGYFYYLGYDGDFWSSSQVNTDDAWSRGLYADDADVRRFGDGSKEHGFSVRCLKDD